MRATRLLAVAACLLLVLGTAVSAKGQKEGAAAPSQRLEILWMGHPHVLSEPAPADGNMTQALLEKRFNVKITTVPVNISTSEKVMLYFAEGKSADMINVFGEGVMNTLADQGLIRTIPEEWLYTYLPTWMKGMESFFGKDLIKNQLKYKGKVWGAPGTNYAQTTPYFGIARKDYMEKVGVTENPKTLDDMFNLMRKLTFDDPDGNGKKDTYGAHGANMRFIYVFGAFGIQTNGGSGGYYERDGRIVPMQTLPEYKEVLATLARWYKEGVIDPEFVTDNRTKQRDKWSEGKLGYLEDHPWWMADSTPQNVVQILMAKNPKAKIAMLEPVKGPGGKVGGWLPYPSIKGQIGFYFGKDTSDEKVKRIMQIKEAICTDHSLFVATNHGVEGTHWTYQNGFIVLKPDVPAAQRAKDGLGQFYGLVPITFEMYKDFIPPGDMQYYTHSLKIPYYFAGTAFPFAGTNQSAKTKGADVNTIYNEYFYNVVTGKANLDADWTAYVDKIRKAGLDDVVAEYQKLFDATK
jgi:putative aldouronate transport system substrate-binding protein